jgi:hypothetical protein
MVIRYAYLWRDEAARGREEGTKDRPCAVVLTVKREGDKVIVVVAPITHSPPASRASSLELPPVTKRRLGLDNERSWLVANDLNVFEWPGPDLRPVQPGRSFVYGFLPFSLTQQLIEAVRAEIKKGREALVSRSGN